MLNSEQVNSVFDEKQILFYISVYHFCFLSTMAIVRSKLNNNLVSGRVKHWIGIFFKQNLMHM